MRVALITGASRGIGKATALRLAHEGWKVVGTVRSPGDHPDLSDVGIDVRRLDVREPEAVDALVASVVREHGSLDALVANAGQGIFGAFEDLDPEQVRSIFETNVFGVFRCGQRLE